MAAKRADIGLSDEQIEMFENVGVHVNDWHSMSEEEAVDACEAIPDAVLKHGRADVGLTEHGERVMDERERMYDLIDVAFQK